MTAVTTINLTAAGAADGVTWVFTSAEAAVAGSDTTQATYNVPGNPGPVVDPTLTINVAVAVPPPPTVTALQYVETVGT